MHKISELPPTALDVAPTPDRYARLQGEVLALRLLLATAVWKAGSTLTITTEEIVHVGTLCKLDTQPIEGGQRLTLAYADPADALVLPPGARDA